MRRAVATCLVLIPLGLGLAGCGYNAATEPFRAA